MELKARKRKREENSPKHQLCNSVYSTLSFCNLSIHTASLSFHVYFIASGAWEKNTIYIFTVNEKESVIFILIIFIETSNYIVVDSFIFRARNFFAGIFEILFTFPENSHHSE